MTYDQWKTRDPNDRAYYDGPEDDGPTELDLAYERIDALIKRLTEARSAIASLPMEALGFASAPDEQVHWPIRDEMLHRIDQVLGGDVGSTGSGA
jgi:hypothetical protein